MYPTTIIEIGLISIVVILLCGFAFLLKKPFRKFVWITAGLIMLSSLAYYSARPFIVEMQQTTAMEKLNSYLVERYKEESWRISDTDAYELQKTIQMHVIFENEPAIVYKYEITDDNVEQLNFWDVPEADVDSLKSGVELKHLE